MLIYRLRNYTVTTQYLQEVWNRRRVVYYAILLLLIFRRTIRRNNYIIIIFLEYDNPAMNLEYTYERPTDTAVNVQQGRPISCASVGGLCSISLSPMDFSPSSKIDYIKCIQLQNNMDIKEDNKLIFPVQSGPVRTADFAFLVPQSTCSNNMEALNITQAIQYKNSIKPSFLAIIPYSANVLADPNLQDSEFRPMSLFDTNEFLQSDICNMVCFLQ